MVLSNQLRWKKQKASIAAEKAAAHLTGVRRDELLCTYILR